MLVQSLYALINTPFVFFELLKPVSRTNSTPSNPAALIIARKYFPGIAPPSHLDQLSTMLFIDCGGSLDKT